MHRSPSTASPPQFKTNIRRGKPADLPDLVKLETACFEPGIRESPDTIRRSLLSRHQEVWVLERGNSLLGALFLRLHKHALRIYSLAVSPDMQGKGLGLQLMQLADARSLALRKSRLILEVKADDAKVRNWYRSLGFTECGILTGYYPENRDGIRMTRHLQPTPESRQCR